MSDNSFKSLFTRFQERVEQQLELRLPSGKTEPARLHEAMRYSVLGGGKRVRPALVYAAGQALGVPLSRLDSAACAVELIHAYSLVHDDLPAMDDDDLRRGRPTVHKAFDEATAVLAGDGLHTLAFELIANDPNTKPGPLVKLKMIALLARASGSRGMVGGQAIDLAAVGTDLDLAALENMHAHKTGALIRASVLLGAYCSDTDLNDPQIAQLDEYAQCIGLAFQVWDDILDVEGDTAVIGKPQGSDQARNKPTFPALLGMDGAKQTAQRLHQRANDCLRNFDERAQFLRDLAGYIVQREK